MRFLADMGISADTVALLQSRGHDAVHLRDAGLQTLDDPAIVRKARDEHRVVLTHDLDFGQILAVTQASSPSLVTFRLSDMRPQSVNGALAEALTMYRHELETGAAVTVDDRTIRCHLLPINPERRQ